MAWETTGDVRAFLAAAGAFMRARPAEHTTLLTVAEMVALRGPNTYGDEAPEFGWWREGEAIAGTFLHTPPYPVLLGPAPEAAGAALLGALAGAPARGINGPVAVVQAVAAAHPGAVSERRRELLYRLGELVEPPRVPGRAVVAGTAHRAQLLAWYDAFAEAIGEPGGGWEAMVDDRLSHHGLHVWESERGEPLAFAGVSREIAGMVRIAPVYTPPEHRGQGIAAALTAAVCRFARAAGASEILLFADLANPTSNGVYRRIGFVPLSERLYIELAA